jgi:hypothetical protein
MIMVSSKQLTNYLSILVLVSMSFGIVFSSPIEILALEGTTISSSSVQNEPIVQVGGLIPQNSTHYCPEHLASKG